MVEETILRPLNVPELTPLASLDAEAAGTGGGASQTTLQVPAQCKMKMSSYLDQADKAEFEPANKRTVDR